MIPFDASKRNQANQNGSLSGIQSVDAALRNGGLSAAQLQQLSADERARASSGGPVVLPPSIVNSLVSYWTLNEASGTRSDSKGTNHLTDNNTVAAASGKLGNGALFTAGNLESLIAAADPSLVLGDVDFAISYWLKPGNMAGNPIPLGFGGLNDATESYNIIISASSVLRITLTDAGGGGICNVDSAALTTGVWSHIFFWHDSVANTLNLVQDNGGTVSSSTGGVAPSGGSSIIEFGSYSAGTRNFFDGMIDEAALWKGYIPTAAEITRLYGSGTPPGYPPS